MDRDETRQNFDPELSDEHKAAGQGSSGDNVGKTNELSGSGSNAADAESKALLNHASGNVGYQAQRPASEAGREGVDNPPLRLAGFWMRFWAYLLDLIVIGSLFRLLAKPIIRFFDIAPSGSIFSVETITSAAIFYLYFVLMTKYFRQTLGKMVFGLAVIGVKGGKLNWMDILFREWIGRFISSTIVILYLIPAFHPKKQALHDLFADTAVIHTRR
ncbi:RDD family protein [Bacillus sp. FJAT-27445]|uniref:RDD family protein n=1 Tax=Bacillus sp. FJAT-27445 TaxID=1679166 RepID=UPI0009EC8FB8